MSDINTITLQLNNTILNRPTILNIVQWWYNIDDPNSYPSFALVQWEDTNLDHSWIKATDLPKYTFSIPDDSYPNDSFGGDDSPGYDSH